MSASLPVSLAIVAAIAGRARADSLARELGVERWDTGHDSSEFRVRASDIFAFATSYLAFWRHETVGIPVTAGDDEIALAFVSNAYASTHIADVKTLAASTQPIVLRGGLRLLPDEATGARAIDVVLPALPRRETARALDGALLEIERRYGPRSVRVVQMELEYPKHTGQAQPVAANVEARLLQVSPVHSAAAP